MNPGLANLIRRISLAPCTQPGVKTSSKLTWWQATASVGALALAGCSDASTPGIAPGSGGASGTAAGGAAVAGGGAGGASAGQSSGGVGGAVGGASAGSSSGGGSGGQDAGHGGAQAGGGGETSGVAGAGASGGAHAADSAFCRAELSRAAEHYEGFLAAYTDATKIPRSARAGTARIVGASDWTSGFPAGTLWLLYEHTQGVELRTAAEKWTQALEGQRLRTSDHDVGFIINNTFGAGYRLTQNPAYVAVITRAAQSLATRFNATVGATRSWDFGSWSFPVIMDNMMNLELFLNAAKLGGNMQYAEMAVKHALATDANHFRSDSSSYHVVDYNPSTGAVVRKQTNQGLADESSWARGQAWGLYGFAMMFRETKDNRFLTRAQAIADYYTGSERMPADGVPYFDFDAPVRADVPDHRDASAGAIAASALFELARFAPPAASDRYLAFALRVVRSLSSEAYRAKLGENSHFLLMHSVGNYPINDEIDVAINYADYYYVEALLRCAALTP